MGLWRIVLFVSIGLTAIGIGRLYNKLTSVPPLPNIESTWWGPGQPHNVDKSIRPFRINTSQEVLDDLNTRLQHVKLTPPLEGIGFQYGFNTDYLKKVVDFWRTKYNWREREAYLNSFPQFKTQVDGLDLHFLHVKPKQVPPSTRVLPLLLLHGWPGSVREFYEIIPLLTTPREGVNFVFEVVVPSLPGYGFSEGASKPGLGAAQMAVVFKDLMARLGFDKFYLQGGDWGVALTDSPVGLAAYILEKFSLGTNAEFRSKSDGGLTHKFQLADLLDNVMIYWVTGSITTSVRLYSEGFSKAERELGILSIPTKVPTACVWFPHEIRYYPEYFLREKYHNLLQNSHMKQGGHFAAMEEPKLLAEDIFSAIKLMLDQKNT
uniref:Epoxide hydrolase n=2 Tax=Timema TaxID=61471 RepID=A0A7R9B084_TIMSH|nr:unnamed protein product [Timema shepardi]CAD7571341.1 unnamed protein product [Timema californicum]